MYSANLGNFVEHFWDKQEKCFRLKLEDELVKGALITHGGALFSTTYKSIVKK
jgi:NAD(P) transhydrogenase subunit alpha